MLVATHNLIRYARRRLLLSDKVAAAKFASGAPVEDLVREAEVLESVRRLAVAATVDPATAVRFFRDQIEASKLVQRGLLEIWDKNLDLRPRHRPDPTTEVRAELDELSRAMVEQLALVAVESRATDSPRNPGAPLNLDAVSSADADSCEPDLDCLHRRGLSVALRSLIETAPESEKT